MNRLNLITLGVKDMVESLTFYRDGLGFEVFVYGDESSPDVIFFNNAGTKISLFQIDRLVKDINEENTPQLGHGFAGITLAYNGKSKEEVDEVFLLAERLVQKSSRSRKQYFGVDIVVISKTLTAIIGKLHMAIAGNLMKMIC